MSRFRLNIGDGRVLMDLYGNREEVERVLHDIIEAVSEGRICIEERTEGWTRLPT